jgi:PadR family transcriptional regulator, regulatory protein PadR
MVALLSALLRRPSEEWYGLELAKEAGLKSGTIYPALARLERAGWLESRWEMVDPAEVGRPRRRLYLLTGEGELAARRGLEELASKISATRSSRSFRWQPEGRLA